MPYFLYLLQSLSSNRFYIGVSGDVARRLEEHNAGQSSSTRNRGPWVVVYEEAHATRSAALARERQLKSWKSHKALTDLIAQR